MVKEIERKEWLFVYEKGEPAVFCSLVKRGWQFLESKNWWCGYAHFPFSIEEFDVDSIDVHGGITYNQDNTIGFDCAHAMSKNMPETRDVDWLKKEVGKMVRGVLEMREEDFFRISFNNGFAFGDITIKPDSSLGTYSPIIQETSIANLNSIRLGHKIWGRWEDD